MERILLLSTLPEIMVCVCVIVFTLVMTHLIKTIKKNKSEVKNFEVHAGKHHWFKVEYK